LRLILTILLYGLLIIDGCSGPTTKTTSTDQVSVQHMVVVSVSPVASVCDYVWLFSERGVEDILMRSDTDTVQVEGTWVGVRWCSRCGDPTQMHDTVYTITDGLKVRVE
jgi:hypothetical protein